METKNLQSREPKDLLNNYNSALEIVVKKINEKAPHYLRANYYNNAKLELGEIQKLLSTRSKKFRNLIKRVHNKQSLRSINALLGMASTMSDSSTTRWRLEKSEKELKIQSKRKDWLKARDEADRLLSEYKSEKGDFYK